MVFYQLKCTLQLQKVLNQTEDILINTVNIID